MKVSAIQNGMFVPDPETYPFYAMLGSPHICGSMILSLDPAILLTAAHCVIDAPHPSTLHDKKNPYFVGYGHTERKKQKIATIVDWAVHPSYQPAVLGEVDMHYDTALVWLSKPIEASSGTSRIALWSPERSVHTTNAFTMGYGYTGLNKSEATDLKHLRLKITQFNTTEPQMIEAKSSDDSLMACHGDSGGPLVVYTHSTTSNSSAIAPFALGPLARIFGVYDPNPNQPTCPVSLNIYAQTPSIIESYANAGVMLNWISNMTGIAPSELIDPSYQPSVERLQAACKISKCHHEYSLNINNQTTEVKEAGEWGIGGANHYDVFKDLRHVSWTGFVAQDFPKSILSSGSLSINAEWILIVTMMMFVLKLFN
ncbi:trypsin-like cysteine/serine peptidase domain-containing protein [Spinellus fusiger]|nr:trypsin-like cysteine/serine peptidase domain-containing protein [Spinellus fusiger]